MVTGIQIVKTGSSYTSTSSIRIASRPFLPKLAIEVNRVNVKLNVVLGRTDQLQSSEDFLQSTKVGATFVVTSPRQTAPGGVQIWAKERHRR